MYLVKKEKEKKDNDFCTLNEREENKIHVCTKILRNPGEGCKTGHNVALAHSPLWKLYGRGIALPLVLVNRNSRGQPSQWDTLVPEMRSICVKKT